MMKYSLLCLLLIPCVVHTCTPPFEAAGQGCYYYSPDEGLTVDSYDVAQSLCQDDGGHLAIVKSQDENTAIVDHFLGATINEDKVLLGARANDEEVFEWVDGTLVSDNFDDWHEDQPSGNGECMGYSDEHDFQWDDFQCEDYAASELRVGFMCERPSDVTTTTTTTTTAPSTCTAPFEAAGDGCYYFSADQGYFPDSYDGAEEQCQTDNGHLAIVKTGEQNTAIIEHFFGATINEAKVLLGARANEDELFEWVDGTIIEDSFDDWGEGQPSGNGECMGYSDEQDEFRWDDFQCDNFGASELVVGFICEAI